MATTFDVIYLGNVPDLDPSGGDATAENAGAIVGQTFGAAGDPLHTRVHSFAPGTSGYAGGGSADHYDSDNRLSSDQFTIDGGGDRTLDSTVLYNATIT